MQNNNNNNSSPSKRNQEGDPIDDQSEYGDYQIHESAIAEIPGLQNRLGIKCFRIMHSESLVSMNGIHRFTRLEELNLSSNSIVRIEGLESMTLLRELNLSCNRLTEIIGLGGLMKLERLIVSHNRIANISGLAEMAGANFQLRCIDIKSNRIRDVKQLSYLQDLYRLSELTFESGKNSNPLCTENRGIYYSGLSALKNFQRINRIDGQTPDSISEALRYLQKSGANPMLTQQNSATIPLNNKQPLQQQAHSRGNSQKSSEAPSFLSFNIKPQKQTIPTSSTAAAAAASVQLRFDQGNRTRQISPPPSSSPQRQQSIDYNSVDVLSLQQQLMQSQSQARDLIQKFEVSEKFHEQRYQKMLDDMESIQDENREKAQKIKVLTKEKSFLEEQLSEIKNERIRMINKTDKREEIVETLQLRITDLIKENGQYHRELAIKSDASDKMASELKSLNEELTEMKGRLRENERTLSEFHAKALDQTRTTILMNEEIRRKYEGLIDENKAITNENGVLKGRVSELLEVCREWEFKYEKKMSEVQHRQEQQLRDIQTEFANQSATLDKQYKDWERQKEEEFKAEVDFMESEFKKVLLENYEKFRRLNDAMEEKARAEHDAKHLMKIAVAKNSEQSLIIDELQEALQKVKKEVIHIVNDRDISLKEVDSKKSHFQRELAAAEDERDRLFQEKLNLEKQYQEIEQLHMTENLELERSRAKLKKYAGIEEELEKCLQTLSAKNIMLDDQNNTIEDLKNQIEVLKQSSEDLSRLQRKYEKQNHIIEDLEVQLKDANDYADQISEENKGIGEELEKKKNIINRFEHQLNELSESQKEDENKRQRQVQELIDLLEECKQNIRRKEERISDLTTEIKDRNDRFEAQLLLQVTEVKQKDKTIKDLLVKYEELKADLSEVLQKNELQKKQHKEALTQFMQSLN